MPRLEPIQAFSEEQMRELAGLSADLAMLRKQIARLIQSPPTIHLKLEPKRTEGTLRSGWRKPRS